MNSTSRILARQHVQVLPSSMKLLGDLIVDIADVATLNPFAFGKTIESGAANIQAATPGDTIATAAPVHIYVPAGRHVLSAPITIRRHNVTLTVDGGATLVPPSNQPAIMFDPTGTPEGYIKHWQIILNGVIWGSASGAGQHGIVFDDCIHGSAVLNEIRNLGGSGLVFDGSCFSNHVTFNRIHGVAGWGINSTGANNHNAMVLLGEIQAATLGAANLWRWTDSDINLRVENMSGGVTGITLDGVRGSRLSFYFENGSNNSGDDILTAATTTRCDDNVILAPARFKNQKTGSAYNLNIAANTCDRLRIADLGVFNATTRVLNVGAGNTKITVGHTANLLPSMITNASGGDLRLEPYVLDQSGVGVNAPADTSENIVKTFTIPEIGPNGRIELTFQTSCTNNANVKTARVRFGGIGGTVHSEVAYTSTSGGTGTLVIQNSNAVNAQKAFFHGATNIGVIKVWGETSNTQDTTASPTLVITMQKATGGDTMTLVNYTITVFPGV